MNFGVITDTQYADIPDFKLDKHDRRYRLSIKKLQEAIIEFNKHELDFVINLGDLIDQKFESFDDILPVFKNLKAPVWHVLGNHDFDSGDRELHTRLPLKLVTDKLGLNSNYYSKSSGDWTFIMLDSNEVGVIEGPNDSKEFLYGERVLNKLKEENIYNSKPWNGSLGEKQISWLKEVLSSAEKAGQQVIVFAHHSLYPKHRENMLFPKKIINELENHKNVAVFMNGHNHNGDYGIKNGIHFVTFRGMVDTAKNSFAIVELSKKIKISGFGRETSRVLEI